MYRHFAMVTVLCTAGLAMFADGENQEARAAHVAAPAPVEEERPAAFATPAASNAPRATFGWNDDADGSFGQPMERMLGAANSSIIPEGVTQADQYPPEYLASLTKAERELLLSGVREALRPPAAN